MIELLFESWIRTAILAGGIGLLLAILRVEDPALRHSAWKIVLAAMFVMPFIVWGIPRIELPILPFQAPAAFERNVTASVGPARTTPSAGGLGLDALYSGVALVLLARIVAGYWFAIRLAGSGVAVDGSKLHRTLPNTRYLSTRRVTVPMTLGWVRPVVLFPASFETWNPAKLRAVIDHEHAHIERRDFLTGLVASMVRAIHWLNPMAWWIEWRLSSLAEHAADDAAAGRDRRSYAAFLLELAEACLPGRLQSVRMAQMPGLTRRIQRLSHRRNITMSKLRFAILGTAGVVFLAAASLISVTHAAPRGGQAASPEAQAEDELVFRVGGGVTAPAVVSSVQPRMTEEALEAGYGGVVVLEAVVRSNGAPDVVRVVRGLGFGLDQAAVEALEQWRFEPGTLNGEPVDVWTNVQVNFNPPETPQQPIPEPEPQRESEGPLRIGAGVTPPIVVSQVHPEMTAGAREERVEGTVVLEMIVHEDGTAEVVRVVRGLGYGLDFAAIDALEQWTFEPATRNGEPVAVAINVDVNFNFREDSDR